MRTFAMLIMLLNVSYFVWDQIRGNDDAVEILATQSVFVPAEQALLLLAELPPAPVLLPGQEVVLAESVEQAPALPEQNTEIEELAAGNPEHVEIPQAWCGVVSGFEDQTEATTFIEDLSAMGISGSLDVQQEQISSTWWVHLPPFKSQADAQSVIDELVAKGIDNFYMRTGELAGGISLGVFSRQQSAATAQSELLGRGYETSIKEIPRYVSKAYVMAEASDSKLLETPEWEAFLATKTKLEVTEKLCETIAR